MLLPDNDYMCNFLAAGFWADGIERQGAMNVGVLDGKVAIVTGTSKPEDHCRPALTALKGSQ
ncbi:hypothetical protein [Mycobacterium sp.]|uniref:hypothetical protein n=1 Tax=Mycobacterium sp. TaxID=1785 RepID=UPI003BB1C3BE